MRCGDCGNGSEGGGLTVWDAVWWRCVCVLWGCGEDWGLCGECDCREHEHVGVILKGHNLHGLFVDACPLGRYIKRSFIQFYFTLGREMSRC